MLNTMHELKYLLTLLFIGGSFQFHDVSADSFNRGVNGGTNCAACTLIVSLTEQLGVVHNESVVKSLDRLCSYLPSKFQQPCNDFADYLGPVLLQLLEDDVSPDEVCNTLRFCNSDGGPKCQLFKSSRKNNPKQSRAVVQMIQRHPHFMKKDPKICDLPGIRDICGWLDSIFDHHEPGVDADGDGFSTAKTLRGTSWRGKDCDDANKYNHPGTKPINNDIEADSNCNGIYGTDPSSKISYEEEFCGDSQPRGIAVLGDSISAHFHLPEEWFDSQKISPDVFKDLLFILENEIDWPELSTTTGHVNNSWPNVVHSKMDSLYQRLFERNRCNRGDYQNIAVNGARASTMANNIMYSLSRNQTSDVPILVFYALVGNDVCNGHPDTFAHMTTSDEMKQLSLKTLQYLDTILPNNSHVVVMGLANGEVLFESLHDRIHPIGRLRNDVTYTDLYDYLNCLQVSPCTGWMNSNATVRNLTTQHAHNLSIALQQVVKDNVNSFKHFKLQYVDCPLKQVFDDWKKSGGEPWQLIEPVDGFHSNQIGQALTAKVLWESMLKTDPDMLGPVNPKNSEIEKIFGYI